MNRIVHFEINADDLDRAADFYSKVFGWKIENWPGLEPEYRVVMTAEKDSKEPGINGGLVLRTGTARSVEAGVNAFVCTVQVDDFDATAGKILSAGGNVAVPKFSIGNLAWQGYFIDTEGNNFGLHQTIESGQ